MAEESPKKSHPLIALLEPMDTFALSDSREETKRRAEALASSERERVDGSVEFADEEKLDIITAEDVNIRAKVTLCEATRYFFNINKIFLN